MKKFYNQMEDGELDGEKNDKEILLDSIKFSTVLLLYLTVDVQKDIEFYRTAVKINAMAMALGVLMFVINK